MKTSTILSFCISIVLVGQTHSADFRSHTYCDQLATIGKTAYDTRTAGLSLSEITYVVSEGLNHDKHRQTAAIGVVSAIYGDASISSGSQAYSIVYDSCKG